MSDRTTDSTTFLLSNGMKQTTYYSDNIYFKDENGKTWKWTKTKKSNPRYKKAVKASAKYLRYFANKKVKRYKLKY